MHTLDPTPDLMLGVNPNTDRHDHIAEFPDQSTLLLYSDGLIERRDASLSHGLADLTAALTDAAALPLEDLLDTVLDRMAPTPAKTTSPSSPSAPTPKTNPDLPKPAPPSSLAAPRSRRRTSGRTARQR